MYFKGGDVNGTIITSASDLKKASDCEFAFVRQLDEKILGIRSNIVETDALLARAGRLGTEHESRQLERYRAEFGPEVVEIPEPEDKRDFEALEASARATIEALKNGANVVFQACFVDEGFVGFADFIVLRDGKYVVQDTKLARRAQVTALFQLAAYVDQLDRLGIPRADTVELLLGDGSVSVHNLNDIAPVYRRRKARLTKLIDERRNERALTKWGDPRYDFDGRCDICQAEVEAHRDLLSVAGMRVSQREKLLQLGITSIDELASLDEEEIAALASTDLGSSISTMRTMRDQARLQCQASRDAGSRAEGSIAIPPFELLPEPTIGTLPPPSPGDLFFDFEGDPLYTEGDGTKWGIDYLFGMVDSAGNFIKYWAHNFDEERQALEDFLDFVSLRLKTHPDMHIYHYANYEKAHLLSIAARNGVREGEVDHILSSGILVDLYPIVKNSILLGSYSYSLKKIEPIYMGAKIREADTKDGGESIEQYVKARELITSNSFDEEGRNGQEILQDIAEYNKYDCESTLELRNWLLGLAKEHGIQNTHEHAEIPTNTYEKEPLTQFFQDWSATINPNTLTAQVDESSRAEVSSASIEDTKSQAGLDDPDPSEITRTPDHKALAMVAAANDYHAREARTFWADHYFRLSQPVSQWRDHKGVLEVDLDRSRVIEDWGNEGRKGLGRIVELVGTISPGTRFKDDSGVKVLYDSPAPFPIRVKNEDGTDTYIASTRSAQRIPLPKDVTIVSSTPTSVTIRETAVNGETWDALPMAIVPGQPVHVGAQKPALLEWAGEIAKLNTVEYLHPNLAPLPETRGPRPPHTNPGVPIVESSFRSPELLHEPAWPKNAVVDIIKRTPPRTTDGADAIRMDSNNTLKDDPISRAVDAILRLDSSYIAIQGPPGTGKTYCGSHIIAELISKHHFRIGVVGQSHAVVENLLRAVIKAGVEQGLVAKKLQAGDDSEPEFTALKGSAKGSNIYTDFITERQSSGFVIGGTVWTFANASYVPRKSLDLLVIDEAGQFSLAATIAASVGAKNILMLGDPQQLPQVNQGTHLEPIDQSALGWITQEHDVLPSEYGIFLAESRRMHPAVTAPVSKLSYESKLRSHPVASTRTLTGVNPGLHLKAVTHTGNTTSSVEEAEAVVAIVRSLIGSTWNDPSETSIENTDADNPKGNVKPSGPRVLGENDFIVVTPYNAQLNTVKEALEAAGYSRIPVGTVDKFQGQEAVISITSLAASSARAASRGLEFLLLKNRLNVAISRAQWASYLIYSPELIEGLPGTPEGVARLSQFITLTEG